jgi:hypothetical protein
MSNVNRKANYQKDILKLNKNPIITTYNLDLQDKVTQPKETTLTETIQANNIKPSS